MPQHCQIWVTRNTRVNCGIVIRQDHKVNTQKESNGFITRLDWSKHNQIYVSKAHRILEEYPPPPTRNKFIVRPPLRSFEVPTHESVGLSVAQAFKSAHCTHSKVDTAGRKNNSAQWGSQWVDQDVESKCMGMEIAIYELDGKWWWGCMSCSPYIPLSCRRQICGHQKFE